jgi:hypothetical protein
MEGVPVSSVGSGDGSGDGSGGVGAETGTSLGTGSEEGSCSGTGSAPESTRTPTFANESVISIITSMATVLSRVLCLDDMVFTWPRLARLTCWFEANLYDGQAVTSGTLVPS